MNTKLKLLRKINCIICVGIVFFLIGCSEDKVEEAISNDFQYLIEQVDEPYSYIITRTFNDELYKENRTKQLEEYRLSSDENSKILFGNFYKEMFLEFYAEGELEDYYTQHSDDTKSKKELTETELDKIQNIYSALDFSDNYFGKLETKGYNKASLICSESDAKTDALFYHVDKEDENLLLLLKIFPDIPIEESDITMTRKVIIDFWGKLVIENTYYFQDISQTRVSVYTLYDGESLDVSGKQDCNLENVIKKFKEVPYFTEDKITRIEVEILSRKFYIITDPYICQWNGFRGGVYLREYNYKDWPDYSYVELYDTPVTDNKVEELNKLLFEDNGQLNKEAKEVAKELGFSKDKLITTEWILQHPKDATSIIKGTDVFQQEYEKIFGDDTNEDNLQYLKEWNCFQH